MPLYSTDILSNAREGKPCIGSGLGCGPEVGTFPPDKACLSWCYLFVHRSKINRIDEKLRERFTTFIHKTVVYRRQDKHIRKSEQPTISGLVFVQGKNHCIQSWLDQNFFGLHLVNDFSTRRTAVISDSVMQSFIQISRFDHRNIRFMPHRFDYYSLGHTLVKITSGALTGIEGYIVRISRDKCLITSIGNMTIAISGISKDSFENVDEYIQIRRMQQHTEPLPNVELTPEQSEIDHCFFQPQSRIDIMAIAQSLDSWIAKARTLTEQKKYDRATEIALCILEEIGSRIFHADNDPRMENVRDIVSDICHRVEQVLLTISSRSDAPRYLGENIAAERQSLLIRFPFLPIEG